MRDLESAAASGERNSVATRPISAGASVSSLDKSSGAFFIDTSGDVASLKGRRTGRAVSTGLFALAMLAGCGAPAPKDYGGSWTPVNRFQNVPVEIPLSPAYTFYASPMDATLQSMLKRWAADNALELNYQAGSDFTLYQPVTKIRTVEIQTAVNELSAVYAAQGVAITANSKRILVQSTNSAQVAPKVP